MLGQNRACCQAHGEDDALSRQAVEVVARQSRVRLVVEVACDHPQNLLAKDGEAYQDATNLIQQSFQHHLEKQRLRSFCYYMPSRIAWRQRI